MTIETSVKEDIPHAEKIISGQKAPAQEYAPEQKNMSTPVSPSEASKKPSGSKKANQKAFDSHELSSNISDLKGDFQAVIKDVTSYTRDELAQVKTKLYERFSAAQISTSELRDKLSEQTRKSATATNKYVHEQPWPVIGASALVGLLLGFVLSRKI